MKRFLIAFAPFLSGLLAFALVFCLAPRARAGASSGGFACVTSSGVLVPNRVDTLGNQYWAPGGGSATYTASAGIGVNNAIVAATNPTDLIVVRGSDTRAVRFQSFSVAMSQTAAFTSTFANGPTITFIKRSTQNSGGTYTQGTWSTVDSADPAATATVSYYTGNPSSLGTQSFIAGCTMNANIVASTGAPNSYAALGNTGFGLLNNYARPLVLHGTNEALVVNMGGWAHAGLVFGFAVTITETQE